ncbi:hypothetical protein Tco_1068932 [Tanacetum coccineum]|uniref:Uncharacterized protein n=1 Tax=Tanacetum coccineum TaxID=301880 RepID=A0ABQ5HH16_9ASTR
MISRERNKREIIDELFASNVLDTWFLTTKELVYVSSLVTPIIFASLRPANRASYSTLLLEALKLKWREFQGPAHELALPKCTVKVSSGIRADTVGVQEALYLKRESESTIESTVGNG